jgi:hypothetical protein
MHVILIPSVEGGIGHISRTATLAKRITELDPTVTFEYVLDTARLRPFNIDFARRTGLPVTLLPPRTRESRNSVVSLCMGHADVVIEDTSRWLIPLRQIVPHAAWISIPLIPVGDELFMDWTHLAQTEGIIWAYAPFLGLPPELEIEAIKSKVITTGPFLDTKDVPERIQALKQLNFAPDDELVVYAPRGMPFGREFGERVLSGVYGAIERLRAQRRDKLRLVLLAVNKLEELHAEGFPTELPEWVTVVGLVTPKESLAYTSAASIIIAEGTSTAHEAAALRTPLVMVPGTIYETWLLGTKLGEQQAAHIIWIERVTPDSMTNAFNQILTDQQSREAMIQHAYDIVTGGGGVEKAAVFVLQQLRITTRNAVNALPLAPRAFSR